MMSLEPPLFFAQPATITVENNRTTFIAKSLTGEDNDNLNLSKPGWLLIRH